MAGRKQEEPCRGCNYQDEPKSNYEICEKCGPGKRRDDNVWLKTHYEAKRNAS